MDAISDALFYVQLRIMLRTSRRVACLSLFHVSARPQLGLDLHWERVKSRTTERWRECKRGSSSSHAVLKSASLKSQNGQLMEADARTLQRLLAFLIDLLSKYYEQSVTTAVFIQRDQCS